MGHLDIAQRGYVIGHCLPDKPEFWCGNTAWFPGYPWLIASLVKIGVPLHASALLVVSVCHFAVLLTFIASLKERGPRALATVVVVSFFPGSIYFHAVSPLAPLVLCALGALVAAARGRTVLAAVFSLLAATMYPSGIVVGAALAIASPGKRRWSYAASAVAGLAIVWFAQFKATGMWDGFWRIQAGYDPGHNPIDTLLAHLKPLVNPRYRERKLIWSAVQTLGVTCFVAWLFRHARAFWREGREARLVLVYGLTAWIFPLVVGGSVSLYRSELTLLPAAHLFVRLPPRVSIVAAFVTFVLFVGMARMFLDGTLV